MLGQVFHVSLLPVKRDPPDFSIFPHWLHGLTLTNLTAEMIQFN